MKGIFEPVTIISETILSCLPKLPPGCSLEKSYLLKRFLWRDAIAKASPTANCILVLDVGTIPKPDSFTSGKRILISEALYKIEFFFETIPISLILFRFANLIIGTNSSDLPELLIRIKISFFVILPKSPCKQSFADKEKEGLPMDDIVEEIFDAIKPLLPTPQSIIFDWQLTIAFTALSKFMSIFFFKILKASIL